jgi:imidazolonepropionase-like amidohydrolase
MTTELLTGISELTTQAAETSRDDDRLTDAALVIENGRIAWIGTAAAAPAADLRTDLGGRAVLPGWVDTHTHLVFAGDRAAEFEARMAGRRYAAGGIATTMAATREASEADLGATARRLLDAGADIALASNCNPGTSYTTSMPFCVATAVLQMGLTVSEAVWAATRGAARAVGREHGPDAVGSLRIGGRADLQVLDAPSVAHLAYRPGVPLCLATWTEGVRADRSRPTFP